jgi:aspartate-semialdehyde dehydrogenase
MTPRTMNRGTRLGIVNPLTLVGNEIKTILRERSFPFDKVVLLDSSGLSSGAVTELGDEPALVETAASDSFEDLDLVFFCGPGENNREWLERSSEDGFAAIDLSRPSAADDAPPIVAGINLEVLTDNDRVVISPHPVAIPIALMLHQIGLAGEVQFCAATVVQPASEFEQAGIEELAAQTMSVLTIQSLPQKIFDRQLAFNLYPAVERQEKTIGDQVRALTDERTELALLVTQGTIFHSHTFSLFVRTREALDIAAVVATLQQNPAIAFPEGDQRFGTIDAAGRDEVLIAEVRPDPSIRGGFWIWAVCDNLRRSSALNAVLIAEKLLFGAGMTN